MRPVQAVRLGYKVDTWRGRGSARLMERRVVMEKLQAVGGVVAAGVGSLASSDELQSLLVALFAIAVREVIYWWRNRRKTSVEVVELPPGSGGA